MLPTMTEIVFLIEEDPEGSYTARALGESIFTQADDVVSLKEMVRDAVRCHFPDTFHAKSVTYLVPCLWQGTQYWRLRLRYN